MKWRALIGQSRLLYNVHPSRSHNVLSEGLLTCCQRLFIQTAIFGEYSIEVQKPQMFLIKSANRKLLIELTAMCTISSTRMSTRHPARLGSKQVCSIYQCDHTAHTATARLVQHCQPRPLSASIICNQCEPI